MCWRKKQEVTIKSTEYNELLDKVNKLNLRFSSLELDLQLYVRKLKASKGVKEVKEESEETENNKNGVILPM